MENMDNLQSLWIIILENDGLSIQSLFFVVEEVKEALIPMTAFSGISFF